jgi:aspartate kinase
MQVWKFGGTSVGKPERMKSIRDLVTEESGRKLVVLSALSGTTNGLLAIGEALKVNDLSKANGLIQDLRLHYKAFIKELFSTTDGLEQGMTILDTEFGVISTLATYQPFTKKHDKEMVAQGEILSTQLFTAYLAERGDSVTLIHALDFMKIDEDGEPILTEIEDKLKAILAEKENYQIIVTQGFICRNPEGNIDNLKRGGSDYTASLIGGALTAEEIQIWTDIDGMHNNDPRVVSRTFPVRHLTFEEAAELAYF